MPSRRPNSKVYARSARSPELGYLITQAIVHGSVEVEKPALPELEEVSGEPPVSSTRTVRWRDGEAQTSIIRLEEVIAGHEISDRRSSSTRRRRSRSRRGGRRGWTPTPYST